MTVSRRQVIAGATGAVLVGAASPALALPISYLHPAMAGVENAIAHHEPPLQAIIRSLNANFLNEYGAELYGDRFMRGPAEEIDGCVLLAKTRKLAAGWTFEVAVDGPAPNVSEAEIMAALRREIYSEIRAEHAAHPSIKVYPYVPITTSGVIVDARTYSMPVMSFMTRYATA